VNIVYICVCIDVKCVWMRVMVFLQYIKAKPPIPSAVFHTFICFRCAASFPRIPVHADNLMPPKSILHQTYRQTGRQADRSLKQSKKKTGNPHSTTLLARGHTQTNKLHVHDKYTYVDINMMGKFSENVIRIKLLPWPTTPILYAVQGSVNTYVTHRKTAHSLQES
jgi:hypothetical protein